MEHTRSERMQLVINLAERPPTYNEVYKRSELVKTDPPKDEVIDRRVIYQSPNRPDEQTLRQIFQANARRFVANERESRRDVLRGLDAWMR